MPLRRPVLSSSSVFCLAAVRRTAGAQRLKPLASACLAAALWAAAGSAAAAANAEAWVAQAQALLAPGQAAAVRAQASPLDSFHLLGDPARAAGIPGQRYLSFERRHQGLRVWGAEVVVQLDETGQLANVTNYLAQPLQINSLAPAAVEADLLGRARSWFRQQGRPDEAKAELLVLAQREWVSQPRLAWLVTVRGSRCQQPSWMHYVFDASNGELIRRYEAQPSAAPFVECAAQRPGPRRSLPPQAGRWPAGLGDVAPEAAVVGTGKSLYSGTVSINTNQLSATSFELRDASRGGHYVADYANLSVALTDADNTWGDGTEADTLSVAADASYGQARTWDYYKAVHARNGIDGAGSGFSSKVHYTEGGNRVDNAFWSNSNYMMYGDGVPAASGGRFKPMASLDLAGHEMSHGVTNFSTGPAYGATEAGGMNESTSDIFGTMVEYHAANASDPPDYNLFEKLTHNGLPFRYMHQPSRDASSRDCWSIGVGGADPHYSSGVANHFFYLLAEGSKPTGLPASPVCKDSDVSVASDNIRIAGVGRDMAAKIWYRSLTPMGPSASFKDARVANLAAAKALSSDDSKEVRAVDYAWLAVNVTDTTKVSQHTANTSAATSQIVSTFPSVVMGRVGKSGKSHWFALYLPAGKTVTAKLTAADATANYDLIGVDTDGKKVLASSKTAGAAVENLSFANTGTAQKLVHIKVPFVSGTAPYQLRLSIS